jgi:hypothetical protein
MAMAAKPWVSLYSPQEQSGLDAHRAFENPYKVQMRLANFDEVIPLNMGKDALPESLV